MGHTQDRDDTIVDRPKKSGAPREEKKGSFYIAQYPVRWTAQIALHFSSPGRPVHSDINSASMEAF